MADPPRMNERQFRHAKQLIRRLCANYDNSFCLLLEGMEQCPCPQLITQTLICNYFRAAVLPADRALNEEILRNSSLRRCIICGKSIFRSSNAAKYCVNCAVRERRKQDAARKRKHRLDVRKSGL